MSRNKQVNVDFCESNVEFHSRPLFERLRERPDLLVREWGCLGNCEQCDLGPYAFVGDQFVSAPSVDAMVPLVEAAIAAARRKRGKLPETPPGAVPIGSPHPPHGKSE
jgi:uncharacterized protein YuzB (UPF0349 family)